MELQFYSKYLFPKIIIEAVIIEFFTIPILSHAIIIFAVNSTKVFLFNFNNNMVLFLV